MCRVNGGTEKGSMVTEKGECKHPSGSMVALKRVNGGVGQGQWWY